MNTGGEHRRRGLSWTKKKTTGPLINVLHETAATHKCFLPDVTPTVIFCAVTHESDILGILMSHSWIWYIAALQRIHNRGIWIKRHRIGTKTFVAYLLIIEDCKEIQDYTLCCSSHSLLTHEPLINLSWTTHKRWASHVHWHEWCRFWVECILSMHRKAISVTFLEFSYSE